VELRGLGLDTMLASYLLTHAVGASAGNLFLEHLGYRADDEICGVA
jgi:hypothetical protein